MWTLRQTQNKLNKAGYKSIGNGGYRNPDTHHTLNMFNYVKGEEVWVKWARAESLPPPPRVVANVRGENWGVRLMEGENGRYIEFSQLNQRMGEDEAADMATQLLRVIRENWGQWGK